eukprot:CAMPEP_0202857298 /NCGR_PEP_ID=MMETSP1391-20130828/297_1 /ASSEMBLY_ACC=CAM_ASM_000867 /TAXON_ID=1034604 /ORGANISM="Chlamydomonas leiostraca, Strain SAG 11-49" /LENGTH=307 /DNA_ID=CAMNT_0049536083 /DNA_START=60 /DNA_END=983 /DNA_ORIENTATION=-
MLLKGSLQAKPFSAASTSRVQTSQRMLVRLSAQKTENELDVLKKKLGEMADMGDLLGPIGLTYGEEVKTVRRPKKADASKEGAPLGVDLGPIGLSYGASMGPSGPAGDDTAPPAPSIHSMTTEEWRAKYEKDGTIDLWVEEEFNSGSRLVGGRAVYKGGVYGFRTGEGPSAGNVAKHTVKITNHYANQVVEVEVPEDRYVMWEAEDNGLELPYACRMGCCTACAVRIKEGEMYQPEALGISEELKEQGYALMCVGYPLTDLVLETVSEDEIYELQFGKYFEEQALDPNNPESIERDDYALSIANMDE